MRAVHESKFVRMPIKYYRYIYDLENIEREKGKNLSDEYLAKKLNIVQSTLKNIKQNRYSMGHVDRWDGFGSDEIPVDQIVDCQDLKEYMFSKIKELSPKQREVLYLTFFSNDIPTLQKTGQKLGISKQAVRMLIVYALRNLKRKIKKEFKSFELENKNKGEKT
jgi:DNA-directed RNA polymerase specialized sigma subunit